MYILEYLITKYPEKNWCWYHIAQNSAITTNFAIELIQDPEIKFDNSGSSSQAGLTDLVADNAEEMSAIALGTNFGGITDIETGPDGFLYILTLDRESDGEGKIYRIVLSQ